MSHRQGRIIPARAGFTTGPPSSRNQETDHPRSRGVYRIDSLKSARSSGSSPLARGLPRHDAPLREVRGIIPARAGFTSGFCWWLYKTWDHPRSRGVYHREWKRTVLLVGSSPLARGLHLGSGRRHSIYRIIPARAGFTTTPPGVRLGTRDHPRSRGVYVFSAVKNILGIGSSPLARGLRAGAPARRVVCGIIPARAGFTSATRNGGTSDGSSPLARGLLLRISTAMSSARIIPARAGFTLGDPWNPNDHSPYQTASAFTADLAPARRRCGSAAVERRSTMTPSEA